MKKRLLERGLSLLLAFVMVLALAPVFTIEAEAAGTTTTVADAASLETALGSATSGDILVITADVVVTKDLTIPKGVTLLLPYADEVKVDSNGDGKVDATNYAYRVNGDDSLPNSNSVKYEYTVPVAESVHFNEELTYVKNTAAVDGNPSPATPGLNYHRLLTLNGATLTVYGSLVLGGQFASYSSGYSGYTTGNHSDIMMQNGAQIVIKNGGVLSSMGFIFDESTPNNNLITVETGGSVYEPFVIGDYNGGTYTIVAAKKSDSPVFPFNTYGMINIKTAMSMEHGSELFGYCDLYTNQISKTVSKMGITRTVTIPAQHNLTTAQIVGASDGLIIMKAGSVVRFSHTDKAVSQNAIFTKTKVELSGDVQFGSMSLTVDPLGELADAETISTKDVMFPIPYNFDIVQESGTLTIPSSYEMKVMPGAKLEIGEKAALSVEGLLVIYDGSNTPKAGKNFNGYSYPTGTSLVDFSERASLVINGKMNVAAGAIFAGKVETDGSGSIYADKNATLSYKSKEGTKSTDTFVYSTVIKGVPVPFLGRVDIPYDYTLTTSVNNHTEYSLAAEIYNRSNGWEKLVGGQLYYAASDMAVVLTSYASTQANAVYSVAQTANGDWVNPDNAFIAAAAYTNGKMTDVKVGSNVVPGMGDYTLFLLDKDTYAPLCASRPLN